MMQRVCAYWPRYAASLLVLALVALAAASSVRAPQEHGAPHQVTAEVSAVYPGSGAKLSGSIKPQPYLRSASRTQSGLRSKTSTDPSGKASADYESPLQHFPLLRSDVREAEPQFPSSFIALRALGPRAPPVSLT